MAVFYSLFIISHIDHDCDGGDCTVCCRLQQAGNFLRQIELCFSGAAFIFIALNLLSAYLQPDADFLFTADPVSLKVRLNN
jgi:hypothetical protein